MRLRGGTADNRPDRCRRPHAGALPTSGGGISAAGTLYLEGTTVRDNESDYTAGGVYYVGSALPDTTHTATIVNSTISGIAASTVGGLDVQNGLARILYSTITANRGNPGGGVLGYNEESTRVTLKGTIVVGNVAADGVTPNDPYGKSTENRFDGLGFNLVGSRDQRGVARPQGEACDAGAFELEPGSANPTSVTMGTPKRVTAPSCRSSTRLRAASRAPARWSTIPPAVRAATAPHGR